MKVLIIGLGHVGSWLKERVSKHHHVQCLDLNLKPKRIKIPVDVMHICFPYSSAFNKKVVSYIKRFQPSLTIIESSIPIGTTFQIWRDYVNQTGYEDLALVHSPIRGTSYNWWKFVKMIGPCGRLSGETAERYYRTLRLRTRVLRSPLETELGKLLDTSIYALNIAFVQEILRMCKKFGAGFFEAYIEFSRTFILDPAYQMQRPVFYPGYIGKECLIPNARLLNKVYPSKFLQAILESNNKRRLELALSVRKKRKGG